MGIQETASCESFREDLITRLNDQWVPTGDCDPLPEELRAHARGCARCAGLLAAFDLLSGSGETITAPPGLANRLADSFPPTDSRAVSASPFVAVPTTGHGRTPGSGRFRWGTGFAAAAVLVVATVFVTALVLGRGTAVPDTGSVVSFGEPGSEGVTSGAVPSGAISSEDVTSEAAVSSDAAVPSPVVVRLELLAPAAESVAVVGDWNGWDPQAHHLSERNGSGLWEIEIEVLPGEEYRYQFLIDGEQWIPDPTSPITVGDGFGGTNSVLNI